jgi:molybdopterin molybdotransferase
LPLKIIFFWSSGKMLNQINSLAQARKLIFQNLPQISLGMKDLPLIECLNRITAKNYYSPENLPAFPRSIMDGYAVKASDTYGVSESMPAYLNIRGEVEMGKIPQFSYESPGDCFKIPTGGTLPENTDAVVMDEYTVAIDSETLEVVNVVSPGENFIGTGEDIEKNSLVLSINHLLRPHDLGLLAGLGFRRIMVKKRLRVAVISTGNEIIPVSQAPLPGQIRDINSINIAALIKKSGGQPLDFGIVDDSEDNFFHLVKKAMKEAEIIIFSGGSSVGQADLGEVILNRLGKPGVILHGAAIKPGKPVLVGRHLDKMIFGLPGHPVSAHICFEQFVQPVISYLSGLRNDPFTATTKAILKRSLNSIPGRRDFIRVKLKTSSTERFPDACPVLGRSSALSSMVNSDGYLIIKEEQQGLESGEIVDIFPFI